MTVLLGAAALLWFVLASLANRLIFYPIRYPEGDWSAQSRLGDLDSRDPNWLLDETDVA